MVDPENLRSADRYEVLPITRTSILASGSGGRFQPEPARSWPRRARTKRPGLSMMSTVGARVEWRPIPRRRLSWLTSWATGAAGSFGRG